MLIRAIANRHEADSTADFNRPMFAAPGDAIGREIGSPATADRV